MATQMPILFLAIFLSVTLAAAAAGDYTYAGCVLTGRSSVNGKSQELAYFVNGQYFGGTAGASFSEAAIVASDRNAAYFVVSRDTNTRNLGYGWTFNELRGLAPSIVDWSSQGCNEPCVDDRSKSCGTAFPSQTTWAVYRRRDMESAARRRTVAPKANTNRRAMPAPKP